MRTIGPWIISIVAIGGAILALWRIESFIRRAHEAQCASAAEACADNCERRFVTDTLQLSIRRSQARITLGQRLIECNVNFIGNPQGREACAQEAQRAFESAIAEIDAQIQSLRRLYEECVAGCEEEEQRCLDGETEPPITDYEQPFEIECIEDGGFICYKEVDEICQMVSGVCDDCWNSFCPGNDWQFESDEEIQVMLVAADSPSGSGRELARSKLGKEVSLTAPKEVALETGEKLFLRFSGAGAKDGGKITLVR
jgi:hypothetical protein